MTNWDWEKIVAWGCIGMIVGLAAIVAAIAALAGLAILLIG